ncbi:histidine phosphatase family protein [Mahella australiensis]|uniref:Phosphoglycerate mutase n=1 Tax=Mahella australiensis (strain DSM 15567 / CIP 107919 / 50-1 BON) TaxID=697281 RepID=F4A2A2_MAHA5|nr:histidine phosphatase family protein [Mahella australiensis]AEE96149.1 Phosphoglycerate mutase [Mahella australiensis 50-1 BON]
MSRWYMVRHGQTLWNLEGKTQGQCDIPLSDKGRQQACAVAKAFEGYDVSNIFCSDLERARETAEIIGEKIDAPIDFLPELREMNLGCWQGLTSQMLSARYPQDYNLWRTDPSRVIISGGESLESFRRRIRYCIEIIISNECGKDIIVVSHGLTLKVLTLELLGMDIRHFNSIRMDNASVTAVELREKGNVLVWLNDTCHLR